MAITPINVGTSANDGTGDPHRTAFQKTNNNINEVTSNGGAVINVTDPVDLATKELNDALANIYASGGGATPDLPTVLAQGNREILKIGDADTTYTTVLADRGKLIYIPSSATVFTDINIDNLYNLGDTILIYSETNLININLIGTGAFLPDYTSPIVTNIGDLISITLIQNTGGVFYYTYNVMPYQVTSGGVTDGDKVDIVVSGGGTIWTIDNGAVSNAKVASGIDAVKIADGSVSNAEFQRLDGVTSNIQTQINGKENTITAGTTAQYYRGDKTFQTLDKTAVGLANVDNTSDANKPVSTAQQTQFDLRVRTLLNDNVDSSTITGTVANTIFKSYLIPANTLAVGDTIDVKAVCSKTGTNANCNFRLYTNTTNSLTSASALALVSPASTNLYFSLDRTYTLKSGNTLESFPVGATAPTDEVATTTAISNTAFNPAVDNYFIVAIQPNNASDSFKQTLFYMTLMKQKTSI